jgi:hypothetical protein
LFCFQTNRVPKRVIVFDRSPYQQQQQLSLSAQAHIKVNIPYKLVDKPSQDSPTRSDNQGIILQAPKATPLPSEAEGQPDLTKIPYGLFI